MQQRPHRGCNLINRHPVNGSLWLTGGYISAQTTNLSEENVEDVDIIFDYNLETPVGPIDQQGVSTFLLTSDLIELPDEAALQCPDFWGTYCGKNPQPKLSGNYKATLLTPYDVRVSLGLRYLGATDDLGSNGINFDAETYWDLTAEWSATGNYIFTAGISNLLDTDLQVSSDAGTAPANGNTFPAFFDALGRYVFVNLGISFCGSICSTNLASGSRKRPGPSPGLFSDATHLCSTGATGGGSDL